MGLKSECVRASGRRVECGRYVRGVGRNGGGGGDTRRTSGPWFVNHRPGVG